MDEMGFSYKTMEDMGVQIPVLEVSCQYKSMVRFGDTVLIKTRVLEYTGTRLKMAYEVVDEETAELRTLGSSGHCFINSQGRAISLKKLLPRAHALFVKTKEIES